MTSSAAHGSRRARLARRLTVLSALALLVTACDLQAVSGGLITADSGDGAPVAGSGHASVERVAAAAPAAKRPAKQAAAPAAKRPAKAAGTAPKSRARSQTHAAAATSPATTGSGRPNYDDPWAVPGPMVFFECDNTDRSRDDPIVFPGKPNATHRHVFFGNTTTDAMSTTRSLLAGRSSCDDARNTSAYWFPEPLLPNGRKAEIWDRTRAYYMLADLDHVKPIPEGLRMLAGDLEPRLRPGETGFVCRPAHNPGHNGMPRGGRAGTRCAKGSNLGFSVVFPNCWDGRNLDSADHKSHVRYSRNGRCPGHWVPIPQVRISVSTFGQSWKGRLASGGPGSLHADFFAAARPGLMRAIVRCLNGGACPRDSIGP